MEIQHVIHRHPLSLSFIEEESTIARCKGCERKLSGPTYGCEPCRFFIHKSCLDEHKVELINHRIHPCTLIFITFLDGEYFECDCCGKGIDFGMFSCGACNFDLHVKCAIFPTIDTEDCLPSAPKTIKHKSHLHPLTLTKSPFEYELNSDEEDDEFYCDVCEQKRNQRELIYYCAECKFIAEVKCVISEVSILFIFQFKHLIELLLRGGFYLHQYKI
ncbi:hypothetical protein V6Z11_A13G010700 [Gossypium hirsutum]